MPPNQTFTDSDYKKVVDIRFLNQLVQTNLFFSVHILKEVITTVLSQVVIFKMERLTRGDPGVAPVNPTLVRYRRHGLANTADPNQK